MSAWVEIRLNSKVVNVSDNRSEWMSRSTQTIDSRYQIMLLCPVFTYNGNVKEKRDFKKDKKYMCIHVYGVASGV